MCSRTSKHRTYAVVGGVGVLVALSTIAWLALGQGDAPSAINDSRVLNRGTPRTPPEQPAAGSAFHETPTVPVDRKSEAENAGALASVMQPGPIVLAGRSGLRNDLLIATASGSPEAVAAMIARAAGTPGGIRFMTEFLADEALPLEARRHAAEVLMRSDTEEAVKNVLAAAVRAFKSGKSEAGDAILSSLQVPVGIEGAKGLLDVLLGREGSAISSYPVPIEMQSELRKALRNVTDAEETGKFMARLYRESQESGQTANANELLNGIAHPAMVVELVEQAQIQGKSGEVSDLFDRLVATDDPGVVGAVARLASERPALQIQAAEVLFDWSFQHPHLAQTGLFADYLNNQTLPPEQRVAAAFGLAGLVGKADARRALEKSISSESDQNTRKYLQSALVNLEIKGEPGASKSRP